MTRKEAREYIIKHCNPHRDTGTQWDDAMECAIKALGEPERKTGWIPCSERLPEEDGLYLVTTSKGQVQVHVFNHSGNSEEYWMRCNKAWMTLPEPYGGEQE